ncbi:hypothetical protein PIIN_09735 [Serendipita indica DSM 11827]|uniref:Uncharacterized protein n=1 Tax=Serendipita indica (strain DSM 11827) TaxID=1109443 RepID=G4TWQ2_SERID|nr:hypothetical protein PIIN_09735 [Serendipita indica DSM 11827]
MTCSESLSSVTAIFSLGSRSPSRHKSRPGGILASWKTSPQRLAFFLEAKKANRYHTAEAPSSTLRAKLALVVLVPALDPLWAATSARGRANPLKNHKETHGKAHKKSTEALQALGKNP